MLKFFIVDVFAERKYSGNQLAVIINAGKLPDRDMQSIAREMHFSETTFVTSNKIRNRGYDVRIFTPAMEVPFAGHPTLGTAYVIHKKVAKSKDLMITLNLKVGQIPVTFSRLNNDEVLWMKQISPTFGTILDKETMAKVLNLNVEDIDGRFPIEEVSTGLPAIITPLKNLKAVKRAKIEEGRYLELIKVLDSKAILVFSPETYNSQNDLNVRFFADYYGVREDPATGSANGCLAAYLVKNKYFKKNKIDIRVEQGYEIDRPSLLYLKSESHGGKIDVNVGGKAIIVAEGKLV
jgi:trans-2,3-dihydro-3-hydroxyanthranilate isomerase